MPRFGLYAIFIMLLLGVMWSATQYMEAIRKENPKAPQYYRLIKYHRFCYAALAGVIGAQSVLFAKCSAELIVNSFLGKGMFTPRISFCLRYATSLVFFELTRLYAVHFVAGFFLSYYQAWMVLICMCLSIFLQIKWLNQGLQRSGLWHPVCVLSLIHI